MKVSVYGLKAVLLQPRRAATKTLRAGVRAYKAVSQSQTQHRRLIEKDREIGEMQAKIAALYEELAGRDAHIQIQHRQLIQRDEELRQARSDGGGSALRGLAEEMERSLLTLAFETIPRSASEAAYRTTPPNPGDALAPLLLPDGHRIEIAYAPGDRSVGAALVSSRGAWEPHVQRHIANSVRPDGTCLDIGAHIGAITLPLAAIASTGRVFAFEAAAANRARLLGNVAALPSPKAAIEIVGVALWDREAVLSVGWAPELAAFSYVTETALDAAAAESRLRALAPADALAAPTLHAEVGMVRSTTLDAWVKARDLDRLDLIKLDAEGSAIRVLRGAEGTLHRFKPTVIVEYASSGSEDGGARGDLYRTLAEIFGTIAVIEPETDPTPVRSWSDLAARLEAGTGAVHLTCGWR